MSEHDTYADHGELIAAQADPRYSSSPRYRAEVTEKLQRTHAAGGFQRSQPSGELQSAVQVIQHGEGSTIHTRNISREGQEPDHLYGSHDQLPGPNPVYAEAARVGSGFFDGPESIARAMGAPQYDADPSYRDAVRQKIERSIRESWITPDLKALPVGQRFTR